LPRPFKAGDVAPEEQKQVPPLRSPFGSLRSE